MPAITKEQHMRFAYISHLLEKDSKTGTETCHLTLRAAEHTKEYAPTAHLSWTREKDEDKWSGGTVAVDGDLTDVDGLAKVLAGVARSFDENDDVNDPDALLTRLERSLSFHAVYDPRFKQVIPVGKLKGEGMEQFAPTAKGFEYATSVLAKDEDEAKAKIGRILMEAAEDGGDEADLLHAWLKAGRKVNKTSEGVLPTVYKLDAYCKRNHQRAAAEKKEGKKKEVAKA